MANKDNQSKQYRIYIKESKSWVDVNKEFYTNYYRDINTYRKRQQEHGRCVCPASKRYLCDMDCLICPYAKAGDQLSLDNTVSDGDGNEKSWLDDMPDESTAIAEVLEDAELLHALYPLVMRTEDGLTSSQEITATSLSSGEARHRKGVIHYGFQRKYYNRHERRTFCYFIVVAIQPGYSQQYIYHCMDVERLRLRKWLGHVWWL